MEIAYHPLVKSLELEATLEACMPVRVHFLKNELNRVKHLLDETRDLISMAGLEEGKANRDVATSARSVAVVAFIYTPLQLVASILSMGVDQGDSPGIVLQLWLLISLGFSILTLSGWMCYTYRSRIVACASWMISKRKASKVDKCVSIV